MSALPGSDWSELFAIDDVRPPEFFRGPSDVESLERPAAQSHAIRQAFRELKVDGILCLGNTPAVYFKEYQHIDHSEVRELHRRVWNQGLAPVLVIVGPKEVLILSTLALPAKPEEKLDKDHRLVATLNRVADVLELRQLVVSLETGEFFRRYSRSFNPKLRVDRQLLKNLTAARSRLANATGRALEPRTLDALLCRVVFTCYLVDRGVIDGSYFEGTGITEVSSLRDLFDRYPADRAREHLYNLFGRFRDDFNGDMFRGDLQAERDLIEDDHINILRRLLRGDDIPKGQMSLGFPAYDFSVIPIETISAIYERFLEASNKKQKKKTGAFYTPRFLAEVVLDTALEALSSPLDKRYLDPACGSGIFLVGLFNRLAEEWRRRNPKSKYDEHADALIEILKTNLFGVDQNETACRIAAFSLYLALLDHLLPPDIQKMQRRGKFLPPIVFSPDEEAAPDKGRTILHADFFEADAALPGEGFDVIVGNPPWASITGAARSPMESWCSAQQLPIANRQLAHGFIWKAPKHQREGGRVCFLLPYGVFFNIESTVLNFQRAWLEAHAVEQVLNLSDMRYYLFENAIRPSIIVRYREEKPEPAHHRISYYVPKTEWETLRAEIITIAPEDRTEVELRKILGPLRKGKAPLVWKERLWGTPRDWKFLDRLSVLPRLEVLAGKAREKKRWLKGQGLQPEGVEDKPEKSKLEEWPEGTLFLEGRSGNIRLLLLETDCRPIGSDFRRLRRLPEKRLFQAPHVLVTKGMRVAFAAFDVVHRHAVQAIHGPETDHDVLMFLAAVLNSPLARYFLFHTAASWGAERPEALLEEVLRVPFPFPGDADAFKDSWAIVREVAALMRDALGELRAPLRDRDEIIARLQKDVLPLVYRYYDVDEWEQVLIEDTLEVSAESVTPKRSDFQVPTLNPSTPQDREKYLSFICEALNVWAARSRFHVEGRINVSTVSGLGIAVLRRFPAGGAPPPERGADLDQESIDQFADAITRITAATSHRRGTLHLARGVKVFDGDLIYVSKPLARRSWTRTAALNDADEVAAAILTNIARNQG